MRCSCLSRGHSATDNTTELSNLHPVPSIKEILSLIHAGQCQLITKQQQKPQVMRYNYTYLDQIFQLGVFSWWRFNHRPLFCLSCKCRKKNACTWMEVVPAPQGGTQSMPMTSMRTSRCIDFREACYHPHTGTAFLLPLSRSGQSTLIIISSSCGQWDLCQIWFFPPTVSLQNNVTFCTAWIVPPPPAFLTVFTLHDFLRSPDTC